MIGPEVAGSGGRRIDEAWTRGERSATPESCRRGCSPELAPLAGHTGRRALLYSLSVRPLWLTTAYGSRGFAERLMAPQPLIAPAFLQTEFMQPLKGGSKIVGDM